MESIFSKQNQREFLILQKAASAKYTKAKKILYSGMIVSVVFTIVFAVSTALVNSELLLVFSSFSAIIVFAASEYFKKQSSALVEEAAKIQQTMDTKLFELSETCFTLSSAETKEVIASFADEDLSKYKNLYNDYSNLSFEKQVFNSQRKNTRLDKALRKKYANLIMIFAIFFLALLVLYTILTNSTISHFFAVASWLFPLEQFFIAQWLGLRGNLLFLGKMESTYKDFERFFEGDVQEGVDCKLCGMQNYIYRHRQSAILVPNWFYNMHKKKLLTYEEKLAQELRD